MEWLFLIPLVALVLYFSFLVAMWLASIGYSHLVWAMSTFGENLQRSAAYVIDHLQRTTQRRRTERRFAVTAGATTAVDEDAVEARRQMPMLRRVFDQELPKAIVCCLRTQLFAARAVGARYIWEIADEPECAGLRYRVVALAETAIEILERYPYLVEDEMLIANLITLRSRVVPTCSNCPYLQHQVESAPLLCPTAITARIDPERLRHEVH